MSPAEPIARSAPREFPSLPSLPPAALGRRLRVCIATCDVIGPIKNGGIGTAYTALARALAATGHDVTIAFVLGTHSENAPIDHYVRTYAEEGIRFIPVPRPRFDVRVKGPGQLSYHAYLWLKRQEFDVIHFHEWMAPGYHSILAKHQGLAFERTLLVCETHSPSLWHKIHNLQFVDGFNDLTLDFMERESVRFADVVVSPSHYLLRWMLEQGWQLPEHAYVEQNILPSSARGMVADGATRRVDELVFFGRLEARKGLVLFCNAIDAIAGKVRPDLRVTFLGKSAMVEGEDGAHYARRRAQKWPFPVEVLSDKDQAGAIGYLRGDGRVAVVASLVENSPYVVLECLGAGVPFLAADVGGLPELIREEDRARSLFFPRAAALAQRISEVVASGLAGARPAIPFDRVERQWCQWHAGLVPPRAPVAATGKEPPLVSVCVVHHDRPRLLRQAIRSLQAQDYPRFEVILVDDGSRDRESHLCLDQLEPDFAARGWRIVRAENRFPGAARNSAARLARGDWLLFMDDDNVARPNELSTFVAVAQRTGAPIVTCQADVFSGEDAPDPDGGPDYRWLFLGGAVAAGAVHNCFGDVNALLRKDLFLSLGGFTEDFGVGHEDWELFARAALAGARIEAIPEALFWYRASPNSLGNSTPDHANHRRSLRPYLERVPPELAPLLELAKGVHFGHATVDKRPTIGPELEKLIGFAHALKANHPAAAKVVLGGIDRVMRLAGRLRRGRTP